LVLRLENNRVTVVKADGRESRVARAPLDDDQRTLLGFLWSCLCDGGHERQHPAGQPWFEYLGRRLLQVLPTDTIRDLYNNGGERLRVLLEIDVTDEYPNAKALADAPWELHRIALDDESRSAIGTSPAHAFSRLVRVDARKWLPPTVDTQLRVLFIKSRVGAELGAGNIEARLGAPGIACTTWSPAQVAGVLDGSTGRADGVDGKFELAIVLAHSKDGKLELDTDVSLTGEELGRVLEGRCKAAMLLACSSAPLAPALLEAGLEGVVAMRYEISDAALVDFVAAAVPRLVAGDALDAAVQHGRNRIDRKDTSRDAGGPALYVRVKTPIEFKLAAAATALAQQSTASAATEPPKEAVATATPAPIPAQPVVVPRGGQLLFEILAERNR
jgi:hypothetical protein